VNRESINEVYEHYLEDNVAMVKPILIVGGIAQLIFAVKDIYITSGTMNEYAIFVRAVSGVILLSSFILVNVEFIRYNRFQFNVLSIATSISLMMSMLLITYLNPTSRFTLDASLLIIIPGVVLMNGQTFRDNLLMMIGIWLVYLPLLLFHFEFTLGDRISSVTMIGVITVIALAGKRNLEMAHIKHYGLHLDLTDSEKNLKKLNQQKDKMFSIVAHDLKDPLNTLAGLTDVLRDQTLTKKEIIKTVEELNEVAYGSKNFMESLLSWARSQLDGIFPTPVSFSVREIIDDAASLYFHKTQKMNITIDNYVKSSHYFFADREMTFTVIRNLISNAINVSGMDQSIRVSSSSSSGKVQVTIADDGPGMSKKQIQDMFKFGKDTQKGERSGIGLWIAKDLVELNDGFIKVTSILGEGTEITITLPEGQTPND
jgi:signal transduction histidine kinase